MLYTMKTLMLLPCVSALNAAAPKKTEAMKKVAAGVAASILSASSVAADKPFCEVSENGNLELTGSDPVDCRMNLEEGGGLGLINGQILVKGTDIPSIQIDDVWAVGGAVEVVDNANLNSFTLNGQIFQGITAARVGAFVDYINNGNGEDGQVNINNVYGISSFLRVRNNDGLKSVRIPEAISIDDAISITNNNDLEVVNLDGLEVFAAESLGGNAARCEITWNGGASSQSCNGKLAAAQVKSDKPFCEVSENGNLEFTGSDPVDCRMNLEDGDGLGLVNGQILVNGTDIPSIQIDDLWAVGGAVEVIDNTRLTSFTINGQVFQGIIGARVGAFVDYINNSGDDAEVKINNVRDIASFLNVKDNNGLKSVSIPETISIDDAISITDNNNLQSVNLDGLEVFAASELGGNDARCEITWNDGASSQSCNGK